MNFKSLPDMRAATRLIRAGRLTQATALLQRQLHGTGDPPSASPDPGRSSPAERLGHDPGVEPDPDQRPSRLQGKLAAGLNETLRKLLEQAEDGGLAPALRGGVGAFAPSARTLVPEGGRFVEHSYSSRAGSRSFKLYVPSGYRGQALPLVVMLHGCTQSPDDFAAGTRMNVIAEERNCLVAYPAQSASANTSKCWNWFKTADQQRDRGEPALIAGITRQVMREHAIDAQRVYVAGLSAGGAAAAVMAAAYPDLYAAVGVHSGLACGAARDLPSALAAMRQGAPAAGASRPRTDGGGVVPTIVFHGDQDATVHPRNGDQVLAQAGASVAGLHARSERGRAPGGHAYSRTCYAAPNGQTVFERWVIHGAGHAWSGGCPSGSYTDPRGPDATREMLRFFLDNPRPGTGS